MQNDDRISILIKGGLNVLGSKECTPGGVGKQLKRLDYIKHKVGRQSNLLSFSHPDAGKLNEDTLILFNRKNQVSKAWGNITYLVSAPMQVPADQGVH